MDSFRGFQVCDETNFCEVDRDWDTEEDPLTDRAIVNALLNASDEGLMNDQESGQLGSYTGWEEAVQGWGRGPTFICLSQMQRRSKRPKTWSADFHCLLCADTKVSYVHVSSSPLHSPEPCSRVNDKNTNRANPFRGDVLKIRSSSTCSCAENLPKPKVFTKKLSPGGLGNSNVTTCCSNRGQHLEDHCPVLKDSYTGHAALMSCFSVLPPLKTSLDENLSNVKVLHEGEDTQNNSDDMVKNTQKDVSYTQGTASIDSTEEPETDSSCSSSSSEDDCLAADSKNVTYPGKNHLLTSFGLSITKRWGQAISNIDDNLSRVSYRLGKYSRAEELARMARRNSGKLCIGYKTKNIRRAEPQLPMLLGTRVPIPTTNHRLLGHNHTIMGRSTY